MLDSGERQVAPTLAGIRRDHVARYEWAAQKLPPGSSVIDFACGIGYGTFVLAAAGHVAAGYDIDRDALDYGDTHYAHPLATRYAANGNNPGAIGFIHPSAESRDAVGSCDAAISFETIEHLEDPRPLLRALRDAAPVLYASVPNEDVMPWCQPDGSTIAFHFRHYTRMQFEELLNECGWAVTEWHGQLGPESEVEPEVNGRTLIAVCVRGEVVAPPKKKHIVIIGLGPSGEQYLDIVKRQGGRSKFCDEVWTINALGDVFASDLVFHMDDVRIQEIRAKAAPASNIAAMLNWIKTSKVPVVTSRTHPDYPALVEYPLEDVLNHLGHDYFNNTAAYAVAFAIHVGATEISLFGMDFTYANTHHAEKGRACVEFWVGQAAARGIKIHLPHSTTLLDSCYPKASRLYGYDTLDVVFNIQPDGELKLAFTEREHLPTAAEIEANYDHSKPVAEQHLGTKETAPCATKS